MSRPTSSRTERLRRMLANDPAPEAPLVGALLRFGHARVFARLLGALAEAGFDDLNEAHLKVLRYPPPDHVRPSVLAERAKMTKQAMNYLLVQLEELGYVCRNESPHTNGRVVSLTERGWEVAALMRQTVRALEADWAQKVGHERFATFKEVLLELVADDLSTDSHDSK